MTTSSSPCSSRASTWTFVTPEPGGLAAACPALPADSGFADVPAGGTHSTAVGCLRTLGITEGTASGAFAPASAVSRGQMAAFVLRLLVNGGRAPDMSAADAFTDDAGSVHERSINALAQAGIVKGLTATTYGVDQPVDRAQMATMMERAYRLLDGAGAEQASDAFGDDEDNIHQSAINRLAMLGITGGTGPGTFSPAQDVRRDQMASFLVRLVSRIEAERAAAPTS